MTISFSKPIPTDRQGSIAARAVFTVALLLGLCANTLHAQVVVVPNELAEVDGNFFEISPSGHTGQLRWMNIFDNSQFSALAAPAFLTQFAWRPDSNPGPIGPRPATFRIYASTTSRPVAELSSTFAENIGPDNTLVFSGTLPGVTQNLPGPGDTRQFDLVFPCNTPFLYDPAKGNLLLDIQNLGSDGEAINFDKVSGDPTIGQLVSFAAATSATGDPGVPPVTQFTFQPIPRLTIRASQIEVCWSSVSNATYQVQYRSALTTNLWTALVTCFQSTSSTSCIYDTLMAGQPQRFYRVLPTTCLPQ